ncbi:26S proteasome subunit RPN7-domain-containing protein [Mycotypha africana]|uniref:26S proteasome subunit RPN7-domain-containing protein n=1 Tax=Mycotypha africana TaxID=64632 RepID=UPI0023015DE6|nr:26S proteasome subunit RPN7-domain-containing protein [Mycotypha africana]KAI8991021.1 26S proteasome subunit RPN7-domain-containing protein [Mycotypha africana]
MSDTRAAVSTSFDFESYINNYTGYTRISRALFIAKQRRTPITLAIEAYKSALKDVQELTFNTTKYTQILEQLNALLRSQNQPEIPIDEQWLKNTAKKCKQTIDTLDAQLKVAKSHINKEEIRISHQEIGNFYYKKGDFANALKNYVRTRDYCIGSSHVLEMCFNTIKIYIDEGNFSHVIQTYISRAESIPNVKDDADTIARLRCCQAIVALGMTSGSGVNSRSGGQQQPSDFYITKYRSIANALTEISFESATSTHNAVNDIISPNDIAIYGSLCALITYSRNELYTKVLNNVNFKSFLVMEPDLYHLVESFYKSKYAVCFDLLENRFRPSLEMDMYLQPHHVETMIQLVREKSMVQYCLPYSVIDMRKMATAFNMSLTTLEDELCALIAKKGKIAARIDSHRKILRTNKQEKRSQAFEKSLLAGEDFEKSTKALLLRLNMMKADLIVKNVKN